MRQRKKTRINQRVGLVSIVIIILIALVSVYISSHRHQKQESYITYQETHINLPQSADASPVNHKNPDTL